MTKTYLVCGNTRYRGHEPGTRFDAELGEDEERRAKERGSIRVVKAKKEEENEVDDDA